MRRHGYPIYDEWIRRNEILLEELERRAARNDVAAQIMLADRLSDTHPNRAEQLLDQALSAGSAFAAGVLADQLSTPAATSNSPSRGRVKIPQLSARDGWMVTRSPDGSQREPPLL